MCLERRAAEGAREVVEINGRFRRSWNREEAPSAAGKNDIVRSSLFGKAAKVPAFFVSSDVGRVFQSLLEECANHPPRDNSRRDFFVEEYEATFKIVAVVRADGDGHTACARVPGAYFYIDRGILRSSGRVNFRTQVFATRWAYRASSLDDGGVWSCRADRSKEEHGQSRNDVSAGEVEHVEYFLEKLLVEARLSLSLKELYGFSYPNVPCNLYLSVVALKTKFIRHHSRITLLYFHGIRRSKPILKIFQERRRRFEN